VEYEYANNHNNGEKYPLYDVITEEYKAFLDYDIDFLNEMIRQLRRIKLRYRIFSYSKDSLQDNYIECRSWVYFNS